MPLLEGRIRSGVSITEPDEASSDPTNLKTTIARDGDHYVINGRKWFTTNAIHPNFAFTIVFGVSNPDPAAPRHTRHSFVIVPKDTPGFRVVRDVAIMDHHSVEGHCELDFDNARVPAGNLLGEEGAGFAIMQARLGPGRIHHCMRTIGKAEVALEKMVKRLSSRTAFGRKIIEYSIWEQRIAEARTDIEMNRLLCLKAADMMDKVGNKTAQLEIAMIKVAAPNMALRIIDNAIQAFGGAGVTDDAGLARDYASMRTMRLADGPDEVHNRAIARLELRKYANAPTAH